MSTSKRLIATLCLGALGALALSSTALANVRHSSSGNDCHWDDDFLFPSTWVRRHEMTGMTWTDQTAQLGDSRTFWCPMVRSLPLSTEGTSDLEIVFRGTEPAPASYTPQAICTAFSLRNDGSVAKVVERQMPIAPRYDSSNGTVYPITKMDFGAALNASSNKGNYLLRCSVTRGVGLFSYYHSEVDGIDGN